MNILTFDVEDWFHLLDHPATRDPVGWSRFESRLERNVELILGELETRALKATFFCLGWIAEAHPQVIQRITAAGHEIGSHSHTHQLVHHQDREGFARELERSVGALEDASGQKVQAYRAPGFSITPATPWAFEALTRHGITVDASIFPMRHAHGGFANLCREPCLIEAGGHVLHELPMSVGRLLRRDLVYGGGGYFRLLPYPLIRRQMRRAPYAMTYFHPRDFDADQPVLPGLSRARRWRSYIGLSSALGKLRRLLDEFNFVDVRTAVARIDWATAPRISM